MGRDTGDLNCGLGGELNELDRVGIGTTSSARKSMIQLDSIAHQSPHQARRRAAGGPAQEPRSVVACSAEDEVDPGTRRMIDILVDMAFRKLLAKAAARKVAGER